jgi:DNA-binding beta-propeller fold protein YncE
MIHTPRPLEYALVTVSLVVLVAGACAAAPPGATRSAPGSSPSMATALGTAKPAFQRTATTPPVAIVREFDAGGAGWGMTKAGGALWIQVDPPVDAIVRIDVESGAAAPAIPGGTDAKFGAEGLWVACCDGMARVDPATGKETLRVGLDGAFALADGWVWTLSGAGLQRLDPATGKSVGKPVASDPEDCRAWKDLIVAFDSAWLACKEGKVVRIDASSGTMTSIATGSGAHTLAVTEEAVWVTNYQANSVSRIDAETNEVVTIEDAGSGVGIATGGGSVWASTRTGIARIDPTTAAIVDTVDLGPGSYYELVWDDGIIWVSTRGRRVLKVDPSR